MHALAVLLTHLWRFNGEKKILYDRAKFQSHIPIITTIAFACNSKSLTV